MGTQLDDYAATMQKSVLAVGHHSVRRHCALTHDVASSVLKRGLPAAKAAML